jgi:hypothetical protein
VTPAENLTARLGGRWHGTYGTSRCPVHDDRKPSLSIRELPISLRYHPTLKHTDTGLLLPTMVAAVQAPDRSITGIHRTYLRADGTGKAQVPSPRKMLGTISGGAVRLAAAGRDLALARVSRLV